MAIRGCAAVHRRVPACLAFVSWEGGHAPGLWQLAGADRCWGRGHGRHAGPLRLLGKQWGDVALSLAQEAQGHLQL